jgi:hypothetical protein
MEGIKMTGSEIFFVLFIIAGMASLRFGVPLFVMWLINIGCCRILKLKV